MIAGMHQTEREKERKRARGKESKKNHRYTTPFIHSNEITYSANRRPQGKQMNHERIEIGTENIGCDKVQSKTVKVVWWIDVVSARKTDLTNDSIEAKHGRVRSLRNVDNTSTER